MSEIAVSKAQIQELRPYLEGDTWAEDGEWAMHCPEHEDGTRSASMNVYIGQWYCQACHAGGSVSELISRRGSWVAPAAGGASRGHTARRSQSTLPSVGSVAGWHEANLDDAYGTLAYLKRRGLTLDTIKKFKVGWNQVYEAYTIPIYDEDGKLANVRFYNPKPTADKGRKMWGVPTHNTPRLFPFQKLNGEVLIGEGEWDIMLTIQHGFPAVTRTAAAKVWRPLWGRHFKDMKVYLCHDRDAAGEAANEMVAAALQKWAREIRIVQLPYEVTPKHGKDLTDFWLEHDEDEFEQLIKGAVLLNAPKKKVVKRVDLANALDAADAGRQISFEGTIEAEDDRQYFIPLDVKLTCGCESEECELNQMGEAIVHPDLSDIPYLFQCTSEQKIRYLKKIYSDTCKQVMVEILELQSMRTYHTIPPVNSKQRYAQVRVRHLGDGEIDVNQVIEFAGSAYTSPRDQTKELISHTAIPIATSVDNFHLTPRKIRLMQKVTPRTGMSSFKKLMHIAKDLENGSKIYNRVELHMAMILTMLSALTFKYPGGHEVSGRIELLILGDARTGKSETSQFLFNHFDRGTMIDGESSTIVGLIGGTDTVRNIAKWGVIPLNDRGLVGLDEAFSLKAADIAKMSGHRSTGKASITKISGHAERNARVRSIWMGNPRDAKMSDYPSGVAAIHDLMNDEDLARFTIAMCLGKTDVSAETMNFEDRSNRTIRYTKDVCSTLIQWAWSRKSENIIFTPSAVTLLPKAAIEVSGRYEDHPPLVQAASIRFKIARIAVALAICTFSTDDTYEDVIVTGEHVRSAVRFIDMLYSMPAFGYLQYSKEVRENRIQSEKELDNVREKLINHPQLVDYLRNVSEFKMWDLTLNCGMERDEAIRWMEFFFQCRVLERAGRNKGHRPTESFRRILKELKI